jgi:type II secretory pathway component GspD/PulD (secretin)
VEISKIGNSEVIIGDATNTSGSFKVLDDLKFLSEAPLKEIIEYFKPEYITVEDLLNILNSTYEDGVIFEAFASLNMIIIKSYDEEKVGEIIGFSENLDEEAKLSDKLIDNIEIEDNSISVNLKDQNVEELLKYVSEKMQESLVFSNVIDEEITLNVKNISWDDLLNIISLTKPVEYEVIDGTYFVKKIQEDELAEDTSEQIYRIYQNAQDFANLVQFYGGTAQVDELNGIVVIKGIAKETVARIMEEVGDTLKNPKKQVEIESMLVDVDETVDLVKKLELYLESDIFSVSQTTANVNLGILDITNPTAVIEDILTGGSVGANIEFSNTLGDAQIISSPSVVAMSGEEGRVHIGDTIPQLVPTLDASGNLEFKLEYIQSGVDLKVTPKVLDNGKISMEIYVEVSEPQVYKFFYQGQEFEYYGKNEKTFESNLVISNGNTLMIGGLKKQDTKKTTKKTPGLSDLPFLGALFTPNDTVKDNNRTLTIFLTARIVEP